MIKSVRLLVKYICYGKEREFELEYDDINGIKTNNRILSHNNSNMLQKSKLGYYKLKKGKHCFMNKDGRKIFESDDTYLVAKRMIGYLIGRKYLVDSFITELEKELPKINGVKWTDNDMRKFLLKKFDIDFIG